MTQEKKQIWEDGYAEENDPLIKSNKYTKIEAIEAVRIAIEKKKQIRETYDHFKTHFARESQELTELRCITAVCLLGQDMRIKHYVCSCDMPNALGYWLDKYSKTNLKSAEGIEIAANYAKKYGFTTDTNKFFFFGFDYDTSMQKVLTKEDQEQLNKKPMSFVDTNDKFEDAIAEKNNHGLNRMNSSFDDNKPSQNVKKPMTFIDTNNLYK